MPVFHVVGDELISTGRLLAQAADVEQLAKGGKFTLPSGRDFAVARPDKAYGGALGGPAPAPDVVEFKEIGRNKPLTIQIRHVYTGKHPEKGFLGGAKDMALVSALKDYTVFAAASRAMNFLKPKVPARTDFFAAAAVEPGTPLVAYYPAVTSDSLTLTIEASFDTFPGEFVKKIGDAFATAAGIPIMLPWAGYLMTASAVTKLVAGWGDALFDGRPAFSFTDTLEFNVPGAQLPTAAYRVLCSNQFDTAQMQFDLKRGLIDRATNKPYAGDEPYVVLSLDGAPRANLEKFAPTVASAAVLQRFFNMRDGAEASVETVLDGLKLLSDVKYRNDADGVKKQLDQLPADSPDRKALQQRYDALVKNIADDKLKPH